MKTTYFIVLALAVFSFTACNKNQKQSASINLITSGPFSKTAGSLFSIDTLNKWIGNYSRTYKSNGNSSLFNATAIKELYSGNSLGVMFYFINIQNKWALTAFGVNSLGELIKTDSVIASNGKISWNQAIAMVNEYKTSHPDSIWGEFFGTTSLGNFIDQNKVQFISVQKGINHNGIRLIITNATPSGHNPVGLEEAFVCPPVCP
jgi:hypothetical protein